MKDSVTTEPIINAAYDPDGFNIRYENNPDGTHTIKINFNDNWIVRQKPARPNLSRLIDMGQFFGMLKDTVCMKLGVEYDRI